MINRADWYEHIVTGQGTVIMNQAIILSFKCGVWINEK